MGISGDRLHARLENLLVVLATGLFAAGVCFVVPTVLEGSDYVTMWKPSFQFLADSVREGRVPFWNPYVQLGRPYLADMPAAAFYPPTYLICLGQETGVFLQVWLHCLLVVAGMRRLAEALGAGRWQSYFMAFSFLASGAFTARWATGQVTYAWAVCYVPWLFYYAIRTTEPWQSRRVGLYAVLLALQLLCVPQVFWFSAVGQAVFIFTRALRLPVREAVRDASRGLLQFGVACVWCVGLLAVVFLPMLELIKESNRSGNSLAFVNSYNLSWEDLGRLFGPLFSRLDWEGNLFVGAVVVVLGCAGLCRVRERNVRGLLGVLVVALLIALGDRTPFFGLFYKWLPGFAGFRFHARATLLVGLVLICAAGIWLSRPHPRLRGWWTRLFGVPIRYAIIGLVLIQSVDLLQGTWETKRIFTYAALLTLGAPVGPPFVETLAAELRKSGLVEPFQPPPRVCVLPPLVPRNYGMIYRYSSFDAYWPLFLGRPWDYLHAVLGIPPREDKGNLSPLVYSHGVFPYPDLGLSVGFDLGLGKLVVNTNPAPRAFLVNAAETADYATILDRLANGHDIHRRALLEKPLAEPLSQEGSPPGTAAIRRFEPESLLVEVETREKALLVLAEAWYPGWCAEIDGRAGVCVPANIWMRAVPVPAGRHQVRVYFRQNYLLPGLLISLASAGLLLAAALAKPARRASSGADQFEQIAGPTAPSTENSGDLQPDVPSLTARPRADSRHWQLGRALAAGVLLVWLLAVAGTVRMRSFNIAASNNDVFTHFRLAETFQMQHQTLQAITHYTEGLRLKPDSAESLNNLACILVTSPQAEFRDAPQAARLAERACELTGYKVPVYVGTLAAAWDNLAWIRATSPQAKFRDGLEAVRLAEHACELTGYKMPVYVGTLAAAYAEAGRFEEAVTKAAMAHELASARGKSGSAERDPKLIELYKVRQPFRDAEQQDALRNGNQGTTHAPR
jgi:hypothetical protein